MHVCSRESFAAEDPSSAEGWKSTLVRAEKSATSPSGELEKFLCSAKCILTETREPFGRRAYATCPL
jgi:hypothetical protein